MVEREELERSPDGKWATVMIENEQWEVAGRFPLVFHWFGLGVRITRSRAPCWKNLPDIEFAAMMIRTPKSKRRDSAVTYQAIPPLNFNSFFHVKRQEGS